MTDTDTTTGKSETEVDDDRMKQAMENTEPIMELGSALAEAGIRKAARESGRTREEQIERMGDRFAYGATEQNPNQKQLDDYAIAGETVTVKE